MKYNNIETNRDKSRHKQGYTQVHKHRDLLLHTNSFVKVHLASNTFKSNPLLVLHKYRHIERYTELTLAHRNTQDKYLTGKIK